MRLFRPGVLPGCLYPEAIFRIKTTEKRLYLTFDDGPDPVSTPRLLDILNKYNIKVLFFCIGRNAEKYPGLMGTISKEGHITGNHGFNHLNGWKTKTSVYLNDVSRASDLTSGKLFRPPFGRISIHQYRMLLRSYKLMLWDLMPYDFDASFGKERSLQVLKNKIRPGSVIVLHDNSSSNAEDILEEFIAFAFNNGYSFALPDL